MMDNKKNNVYDNVNEMKSRLEADIHHLELKIQTLDDPKGKAMFETAKEVLNGLVTAFHHFQEGNEEAWR